MSVVRKSEACDLRGGRRPWSARPAFVEELWPGLSLPVGVASALETPGAPAWPQGEAMECIVPV